MDPRRSRSVDTERESKRERESVTSYVVHERDWLVPRAAFPSLSNFPAPELVCICHWTSAFLTLSSMRKLSLSALRQG